ncbi:MAG: hypothetical protein ACIAXF_06230 [Phycisphaerales bacterium JB063]
MITVTEKHGRRLSDNTAELLYLVRGTTDDIAARTALLSQSPATHNLLPRDDAEVEELEGLDAFLGTVRHGFSGGGETTGGSTFTFDTTGGTQHITQSLSTVGTYAAAGVPGAPDFQGAIGVSSDQVEGVDITVPMYGFAETHYLSTATVTQAYKGTLFNLTGKVNSDSFRGLSPGECLFLGATGALRADQDDWEITFRFAGSPNKTGLTVAGWRRGEEGLGVPLGAVSGAGGRRRKDARQEAGRGVRRAGL